MANEKLSDAEQQALQWYAWENGRRWKQALRDDWMRACSRVLMEVDGGRLPLRQLLQGLRNSDRFGPAGLVRYRLPDGFVFKARS